MIWNIFLLISAFTFMEGVAWFTHKYIMHGPLWMLHKDHHHKRKGWFEMNDFFFLMFSTPSALLIWFGLDAGMDWRFFVGAGIALYGMAYFMMHDILVHRRFRWF